MKNDVQSMVRNPEENLKFKELIRALVWAKKRTGKPSAEIVQAVFSLKKDGLA